MKKMFALFLCGALVLALGTGCGKKETAEAATEPAAAQTEAATAPAEEAMDKDGLLNIMAGSVDYLKKGVSYDYVMTVNGEAMTSHYAFKDGNVRFEAGEAERESIMLTKGDSIYMINLAEKTGFKMPNTPGADVGGEGPGDVKPEETMDKDSIKVIGSEDIEGEPCHVIVTKDMMAGYEMKMWVHKKYGIMMKMEAESPEGKMLVEIKNLKVGDIPDSEFEIPADVTITDMADLQMPEVPQQ